MDPGRSTFLLVDDDDQRCLRAAAVLRDLGCVVWSAGSAHEAACLLIGGLRPDAVIAHAGLHDLREVSLPGVVRALANASRVRVLAIVVEPLVIEGAFDGLLSDPVDPAELAAVMDASFAGVPAVRPRIESERRYAALWGSGMVGIVVADVHGSVLEANDAYLRMVGYSRVDLEAGELSYQQLTPPEHRERVIRNADKIATQGYAEPWDTETFRKDGSRTPISVGVIRLDDTRNLAIVTDLSVTKRAEDNLRRTEEQLRQAQKMEAVGRLAGGVAHDFNNLLSIIIAYPQMLLAGLEAKDPMRADLEEIARAGTRAAELTKQLLLFSRQQVIEPKVVDLNQILGGMQRMIQRLIGEDVELTAVLDGSLGQVVVDPGHLEQVVLNLAINSRDAMPTGGALTIETSNVVLDADFAARHVGAEPGRYVMLAISDNGCGMEPATQARIFEPFFTTKGVGKGTGLGLSTVFGIVQQSHGHIWVYSEVGHGTTFKVYLPRVDATVDPRPATGPLATLRGHETILLTEDEDQVRVVARTILRRYGYTVLEARNAGEALLLCEQHPGPIHALVSDVVMPGMSGPELAQRLRRSRPAMRVLCMSGYTDDSVVRHGLVDKRLAFLQKPLTPDGLGRKLRDVLDAPTVTVAWP